MFLKLSLLIGQSSGGTLSVDSPKPFIILLFGSAWSCPECSGAENPETARRANQEPPGTDLAQLVLERSAASLML